VIRARIEIELVYPYKQSLDTLLDFVNIWACRIIKGGTSQSKAVISMPVKKFKNIFATNPRIGKYKIPAGTEHFISSVEVKKIITA